MKYGYIHDLNIGGECYLKPWLCCGETKARRVRWNGKSHVPDGCCNTLYEMTDLDTEEKFYAMSESYTRPKDW